MINDKLISYYDYNHTDDKCQSQVSILMSMPNKSKICHLSRTKHYILTLDSDYRKRRNEVKRQEDTRHRPNKVVKRQL